MRAARGLSIGTSADARGAGSPTAGTAGRQGRSPPRYCASPASVVTGRRATSSTSSGASGRQRGVQRDERLVEHQQIGLDGEGARQRDAARQAERKLAGIVAGDARPGRASRTARQRRVASPAARQAARSPRPCATAAAAAPGTPRRACRAPAADTVPSKSRSSPAMMRSNVVLPQPDGPTSAATSPLRQAQRELAEHVQRVPPEAAR